MHLEIRHLMLNDSGSYKCQVMDAGGNEQSAMAIVEVTGNHILEHYSIYVSPI